jgi:hypothetical protein
MTTLAHNRTRNPTNGIGGSLPDHRSGPYIEQLSNFDTKGRFRSTHYNFPGGLITETLSSLHSLLDESSREKRSWVRNYEPLAALSREIEDVVRGDRMPADDILDDRLAFTDFERWNAEEAGRHRIMLDAQITKSGNLSVRFSPQFLGESGRWEHAPEWRDILSLQTGETTQRARDEVLLIRNAHWLFEGSLSRWNRQGDIDRTEQSYIAAACRAVNMAFWLTVRRLEQRFEVHLGRYVALLSSTSDALDCLGLELVDALAEHRASVKEAVTAFEATSGHSPQSFWNVCGSGDALGYVAASKELRGVGPSAKLTPSTIEKFHRDLRQANAYGLWTPGSGEQDAHCEPPEATDDAPKLPQKPEELPDEERPLPPGRTVRIGLIPVYPFQQPKAPTCRKARSPVQPPDYSRIARYSATEKELASAGVCSVDELVDRINEFVGRGIQFPVTQSDFPNSRKKFERLTALLVKLSWDQTASNG